MIVSPASGGFPKIEMVRNKRDHWVYRNYIYFAGEADMSGLIKIGCSHDIKQRRSALRATTKLPVEMLAFLDAGIVYKRDAMKFERLFHTRFESDLIHGEWFSPTEELLDLIAEVGPCNPASPMSVEDALLCIEPVHTASIAS